MDTLVRDPFREVMPAFFGMSLAEMLRLKHPNAWGRFERGELSEAEFLPQFFADGRRYDHEAFKRAIFDAYAWLDGMQELLGELARHGTGMHVLSNYPVWHRSIEQRLGLSRYVSWSFLSCNMGLRKPDAAIFERAASSLELPPSACLLVDDRPANCEGARAVGMQAVQFEGDAARLRGQLQAVGISARA